VDPKPAVDCEEGAAGNAGDDLKAPLEENDPVPGVEPKAPPEENDVGPGVEPKAPPVEDDPKSMTAFPGVEVVAGVIAGFPVLPTSKGGCGLAGFEREKILEVDEAEGAAVMAGVAPKLNGEVPGANFLSSAPCGLS